jgi:hypothetical protein
MKSVRALLAGLAVLTVTSFAIEFSVEPLLRWAFPTALPNPAALGQNVWVWTGSAVYSLLCVALGGYVCARLAPRAPVPHAMALGLAQAGLTVLAMFALPHLATVTQWLLLAALAIPAATSGGWLQARRVASPGGRA